MVSWSLVFEGRLIMDANGLDKKGIGSGCTSRRPNHYKIWFGVIYLLHVVSNLILACPFLGVGITISRTYAIFFAMRTILKLRSQSI